MSDTDINAQVRITAENDTDAALRDFISSMDQTSKAAKALMGDAVPKEVAKTQEGLENLGKVGGKVGQELTEAFGRVQNVAGIMTGGIISAGAAIEVVHKAVTTFATDDRNMTRLRESYKLTGDQIKIIGEQLEQMSAKSGLSLGELTEKLDRFATTSGRPVEEVFGAFRTAINAAVVTGGSFDGWLSASASAINNYKLSTADAQKVVMAWKDTVPTAVMDEFAAAMGRVSEAQRNMGLTGPRAALEAAETIKTIMPMVGGRPREAGEIFTEILSSLKSTSSPEIARLTASGDITRMNQGKEQFSEFNEKYYKQLESQGAYSDNTNVRNSARNMAGLSDRALEMIKKLHEESTKIGASVDSMAQTFQGDPQKLEKEADKLVQDAQGRLDYLKSFMEKSAHVLGGILNSDIGAEERRFLRGDADNAQKNKQKFDEEEARKAKELNEQNERLLAPPPKPGTATPAAEGGLLHKTSFETGGGGEGFGRTNSTDVVSSTNANTDATNANTFALVNLISGGRRGPGGGSGIQNAAFTPGAGEGAWSAEAGLSGGGAPGGGGGLHSGGGYSVMSQTGGGGTGGGGGGGGGGGIIHGPAGPSGDQPRNMPSGPVSGTPRGGASNRIARAKAAMQDQLRKDGVPEEHLEEASNLLSGQGLAESELNPQQSHDGGIGYGIYGAHGSRRSNMMSWLKDNGYAPDSLEGQAKFMAHEAMTNKAYGTTRNTLMNADSANREGNTNAITKNFEGPKVINRRSGRVNQAASVRADANAGATQVEPQVAGAAGGPPGTGGGSFVGKAAVPGVDPRITEIVSAASKHLPEGYSVSMTSGYRGPNVPNHNGHAADFHIVGPDGKTLTNRGEDPTGMYTKLAQHSYGEMLARHPDLKGQFAWGGAFGTQLGGGGQRDLMHYDINGERGRYSQWQLSRMGAVKGEKYGDQFQPQSTGPTANAETDAMGIGGAGGRGDSPSLHGDNLRTHFGHPNNNFMRKENEGGSFDRALLHTHVDTSAVDNFRKQMSKGVNLKVNAPQRRNVESQYSKRLSDQLFTDFHRQPLQMDLGPSV